MAFVTAWIPAGFSKEEKKAFIEGTKKVMLDALEFPDPRGVSVWLQEYEQEDMCEHAKLKMVLIAYTTMGKTEEMKQKAATNFEQLCKDIFGDRKGDTFIIFKEHEKNNLCVRGVLKSNA